MSLASSGTLREPSAEASGGHLCPSAQPADGAILLGVVGADSRVGYVYPQVRVDPRFFELATTGRAPDKRFRFAHRCVEAKCVQWQSQRCRVIDAAVEAESHADNGLPQCSIRPHCRWFAQRGRDACGVCPLVITNVAEARVRRPQSS